MKLDGRDDPCDQLDYATKARLLKGLRDWAGRDWLEGAEHTHPLKRLLDRTDWLATAELLTLGNAVQVASRLPSGQRFLSQLREHLHREDQANWPGHVFELVAVSLFHRASQRVVLPPGNQAGFDLALQFVNDSQLQISCKALGPSQPERAFRRFSAELFCRLATQLPAGLAIEFQVWRHPKSRSGDASAYEPAGLATRLAELAERWTKGGDRPAAYGVGPWFVTLGEVNPLRGASLWNGRASFGLMVHEPQAPNEGLRVRSKIIEGLQNMSKNCVVKRPGLANALLVKIPSSASMKSAVAFAEDALREHTGVSCVYFSRSQLTLLQDNETSALGHEFRVVPNPVATVHYRDLLPNGVRVQCRPFYGQVLAGEPNYEVRIGDQVISLGDAHVFYKADRTYWSVLEDGERKATAICPRRFTESISWAFTSSERGTEVVQLFEAPNDVAEVL